MQVTIKPRPDAGRVTILSKPAVYSDEMTSMNLTGYGWSIVPHPLWWFEGIEWTQKYVEVKSTGSTSTSIFHHGGNALQYGPETIDNLNNFFEGTISYRSGSVQTTITYTITDVVATFWHQASGRIVRFPASGRLMTSAVGTILCDY